MTTPNVDTPDYQVNVVSAQAQLAATSTNLGNVTVGIPPNAETLLVGFPTSSTQASVIAVGVTTGTKYPAFRVQGQAPGATQQVWAIDVSQPVDGQVEIDVTHMIAGATWYVWSDAAAHIVIESSLLRTGQGVLYTVPSPPSELSQDHPPNELQTVSAQFTGTGILLPALGAGLRYRVFCAQIASWGGSINGGLSDSISGNAFCLCGNGAGGQTSIPLSGIPLTANAAVEFFAGGGAGDMAVLVVYTIESV